MAVGSLLPSGYETLEDANGVTIPGGLIWTYAAGTTTPLGTFTDSTLLIQNSNPIIADGAGRWLAYAAPGTGFKLVFETPAIPPAHGATIKTCDNVAAPLTDATAGATGGATVISDNTTGTANNFILPGRTKDTLWVWNGSADLVITGIAGAAQGDRLTIKNISTVANRRVQLMHMNAASTNQFLNAVTTSSTLLLPSGWAQYVFVGGTWVLTDHQQGEWYTRPFVASNFVAISGTWTVAAAARDAFWLNGKTLHHAFDVTGTLSAGTNAVVIILAYGVASGSDWFPTALTASAGVLELGTFLGGGGFQIQVSRTTPPFPAGNCRVIGQLITQVV